MLSTFTSPSYSVKIVDNYGLRELLKFSHLFPFSVLFPSFTLLIFFFASFSSFFMPTFFSYILFLLSSRCSKHFFPPTFPVVFCFSFLFFLLFPYLLLPFFFACSSLFTPVLRIWTDPGSQFFHPESRIQSQKDSLIRDPDPYPYHRI